MSEFTKINFIVCLLICLAGCATPADHRYVNEEHMLKNIKDGDRGYFKEYRESVDSPDDSGLALKYMEAGITLSRSACYKHLDVLASRDNNVKYGKEQFGILVILGSGILGLNDAASENFSRLALAGSAINSSVDLYRNYYLLGPDSDIVVDKIKEAMEAAYKEIIVVPPKKFKDAYIKIESFARICSSSSIRRLVRDALREANFVATSELQDTAAQIVLDKVAKVFNRSGLNDEQYFAIYWEVFETPADNMYKAEVQKLLGDITIDDVKKEAELLKSYYRQIPKTVAAYSNKLKELRKKVRQLGTVDQQSPQYQADAHAKLLEFLEKLFSNVPNPDQGGSSVVEVNVKKF